MRFLSGIVVGVLLVVGAAYIHDAAIDPAQDRASKVLVNWEMASQEAHGLGDWMHMQWIWLNAKFRTAG